MTQTLNRRQFLGQSAAGAALAGLHSLPLSAADRSPNEKLNIACVGVGNKGWHNIEQLKGENIVALCDVDTNFLERAAAQFPKATKYRDYRKLLDAEHGRIDAVVVSTADHTHAGPAALALTLGKHVYCEKPLAHTVQEARHLAKLAAKHRAVTQMGTQIHAGDNYRRVVELVQAGAVGTVREVYHWCNRGWAGGRFEKIGGPAPETLDWDLWLGPAPARPFCADVHPKNWRKYWEFGAGTFGDMAAHIMDLSFWALKLRHPTRVTAEGPPVHPDGAPAWVKARYDFPARGELPPVTFYWSDGGKHFEAVQRTKDSAGKPLTSWGLGVLFVGDKGMLAANYNARHLLPKEQYEGFRPPEPTIPASVGHWNEWVQACKTGGPTSCNFDYSGALTENLLLGIVAYRSGQAVEWDAKALKAGSPEAQRYVAKEYRKGWEVAALIHARRPRVLDNKRQTWYR